MTSLDPDAVNRRRRADAAGLVTLAFGVITPGNDPSSWDAFTDAVCALAADDDNLRLTVSLLAILVAKVLTTLCAADAPHLPGADPRQVGAEFALAVAAADWGQG